MSETPVANANRSADVPPEVVMSKETVIADKCYVRITANNGWHDRKYAVLCILDAIQEAVAAQPSVQSDGAWVCDRCGHNATSQYCSNCNLPFPPRR